MDPDRANRRWNGEMSERKTTQRIDNEMCKVNHSIILILVDLNLFSLHFI